MIYGIDNGPRVTLLHSIARIVVGNIPVYKVLHITHSLIKYSHEGATMKALIQ